MSSTTSATVYYDGDCTFCQACARFVERRDRKKQIKLVPLQQSEHARADGCYETIVFTSGDRTSQFSDAMIDILTTLGGFWWFLGTLIWIIPRPLRDWGYRLAGKHRFIFGKKR